MTSQYKFVGAEAFTEDGVLIFNIEARVAAKYSTIEDIQTYFKQFGRITEVHELCGEFRKPPPKKLITYGKYKIMYEQAKSAAQALQVARYATHSFKNETIVVKACYSNEQPPGQKSLVKHDEISLDVENNPARLDRLNDDCVENIFKFLAPSDQINFAISCRRFAAVFAVLSKVQYKHIDFDILVEGMSNAEVHIFLHIVGPHIKGLKIMTARFVAGCNLSYAFSNVEKLEVIMCDSYGICKLTKNMNFLQELKLDRCRFGDELINILVKFKHLKRLEIFTNPIITGSGVKRLTGLKQLALVDCPNIVPQFEEICKNLPSLNNLDISNLEDDGLFDTKEYQCIATNLLQLESLKITCFKGNYNCLAELPNLVKLEIHFGDDLNCGACEKFFEALAKHQANKLKELNFFSEKVVFNIATVAKLQKLKVLKCNSIANEEFVNNATALKQLEDIELYKPLDLTVNGVFRLLENCTALKNICLWDINEKKIDFICKIRPLLEKQRDQGYRTNCVNMVFKTLGYTKQPPGKYNSEMLKVTEEFVDLEYSDVEDFDDEYLYYSSDDEMCLP